MAWNISKKEMINSEVQQTGLACGLASSDLNSDNKSFTYESMSGWFPNYLSLYLN